MITNNEPAMDVLLDEAIDTLPPAVFVDCFSDEARLCRQLFSTDLTDCISCTPAFADVNDTAPEDTSLVILPVSTYSVSVRPASLRQKLACHQAAGLPVIAVAIDAVEEYDMLDVLPDTVALWLTDHPDHSLTYGEKLRLLLRRVVVSRTTPVLEYLSGADTWLAVVQALTGSFNGGRTMLALGLPMAAADELKHKLPERPGIRISRRSIEDLVFCAGAMMQTNQDEDALNLLLQVRDHFYKLSDTPSTTGALLYASLRNACRNAGELNSALDYGLKAVEICQALAVEPRTFASANTLSAALIAYAEIFADTSGSQTSQKIVNLLRQAAAPLAAFYRAGENPAHTLAYLRFCDRAARLLYSVDEREEAVFYLKEGIDAEMALEADYGFHHFLLRRNAVERTMQRTREITSLDGANDAIAMAQHAVSLSAALAKASFHPCDHAMSLSTQLNLGCLYSQAGRKQEAIDQLSDVLQAALIVHMAEKTFGTLEFLMEVFCELIPALLKNNEPQLACNVSFLCMSKIDDFPHRPSRFHSIAKLFQEVATVMDRIGESREAAGLRDMAKKLLSQDTDF